MKMTGIPCEVESWSCNREIDTEIDVDLGLHLIDIPLEKIS